MIKASVIGATGYIGEEIVRLLSVHPHVKLQTVTSQNHNGQKINDIYPNLNGNVDLYLTEADISKIAADSDVVFLSLPHGHSGAIAEEILSKRKKVIDMGADFRLKDGKVYEHWYKVECSKPELLEKSVYGLSEINRESIKKACLIGNPGCYPTSIILGFAPLLEDKKLQPESIIIDSKSGISGAGRSANVNNLFTEINGNIKAYGIGSHRHVPEINQELGKLYGQNVSVTFTPHVVPMTRGILSTMYCKLNSSMTPDETIGLYREYYKNSTFVKIMDKGIYPQVKWVYGSNYCSIGFGFDEANNRIIIMSVIDNLIKGGAGQGIQNMNIMFDLPEGTALEAPGLYI